MHSINPFVWLAYTLIQLYTYVIWAWFILGWAITLNIVNRHQPVVQRVNLALFKLTEPVLRPIRRRMPDLGSIDISPIVLIVLLNFFQQALLYYS